LDSPVQQLPKQERRQPLAQVLLIVLIPLAAYLWWRPIQAEHDLERATPDQLRRITSERPGYARAFYYLGLRLEQAGGTGPALDALERAAELDPDDPQIWAAAADAANRTKGPVASFRVMDEFLKHHSGDARIKRQRAWLLRSLLQTADGLAAEKRYKETIPVALVCLDEEPASQAIQRAVTRTVQAGNTEDEAFAILDGLVRKHPGFVEGRIALADLFFRAGFHMEARRQLEEAVRQDPNNAKAWYDLGRVTSEQDLAVAENAYQRAASLRPDNALGLVDLAAVQATNLKLDLAEKNYRRALKLAPNDPIVLAQLSGYLVTTRPRGADLDEAERLARQALALDPQNGDALYYLGRAVLERGNGAQAVALLEKALTHTLTAEESEAWYLLARAYTLKGDMAKATAARTKSLRIHDTRFALARAEESAFASPQDPALRLKVARLYAQHGDYVKAISQYQGCLALDPGNAAAKSELDGLTARLKRSGKLPSMTLFQEMVAAAASPR
jgi:cytochrome c-type biogenesis protein CcmH/NrfG